MRSNDSPSTPRLSLRLAGAALAFLTADAILATPSVAETITLRGIVRDFSPAHPDFDVNASHGDGHYAANVDYAIGVDTRPVLFLATGFKVREQWRDRNANPLAPHMFLDPGDGDHIVLVDESPTLTNNPVVDTFDSGTGPYGGPNVGPAPTWETGSPMPSISPPNGLPYQEKYERANGTHSLSASFECKEFILKDQAVLRISGDVVIRANEKLDLINQAEIEIMPGGSLELWCGKDAQFTDQATVNVNTATPSLCRIYHFGSGGDTFKIQNGSDIYAMVVSPQQRFLLQDHAELYGRFTGKKLSVQNSSGYHHDGMGAPIICTVPTNDTAGERGVTSRGGISSPVTFADWFVDKPGINASARHDITLTRDGSGIFTYLEAVFAPIDDRMYGNHGDTHNYCFTYSIGAEFVYNECFGEYLQFGGGDGAWVFIDGAMVVDLGGMRTLDDQYIHVDRLGLVDGETYTLELFFAQRTRDGTPFRLRTTLGLSQKDIPTTVSSMFD